MNILRKEDPYLKIGSVNDRSKAADSEYVWALKDIDFKVEQGDVVGIIGKNGAGKSTLLKLLSRVTGPTTGSIRAKGRIGSLLEVGTGFHPEMTGRENIYMNGAILGMSRQEITRKLDEIVDFSGCERYIDTPIKRYSSGMMVRLGFAVAAHLDPEILVVDEVLAVGDAEFQKKAIGKMQDVSKGEGRTVLFVSHNMSSIRALCKNGVLLGNGTIQSYGDVDTVVNKYIENNLSELRGYSKINNADHDSSLSRELEYTSICLLNDCFNVSNEEPLCFEMTVKRNKSNINRCQFGVVFRDESYSVIGAMYSNPVTIPLEPGLLRIRMEVPAHQLAKGKYSLNFNIAHFDYNSRCNDIDIVKDVIRFEVNFLNKEHTIPFGVWNLGRIAYRKANPVVSILNELS